ncbi:MAG: hypothetical protein KBS81_03780 [Spirochaetales bacterium]|nr:hypothetical protein [Candidatus Physcosoma equi]
MVEKTKAILFPHETPEDMFVTSRALQVYDVEKNASTGEEMVFPYPYSVAMDGPWSVVAKERLRRYFVQKFLDEGYIVRVPEFRGEQLPLLVEQGGKRIIIVFALESEDERFVWFAEELKRNYQIVIISDMGAGFKNGVWSVSLDDALDSFNFRNV